MGEIREWDEIREWIRLACQTNNVGYLTDRIDVEFNNRFTKRMGDAILKNKHTNEPMIRLSAPLWPRASKKEQRNTVIHEACHIITRELYGYKSIKSHGPEWQRAMRNAGERPERTHSVDRTGLRRKQRRFKAYCMHHEYMISGRRRAAILRGTNYICRKCNTKLKLG